MKETPTVRNIVYFEHQVRETNTEGYGGDVKITPFYEVVNTGRKLSRNPEYNAILPSPKDTAIIMYTSGSTGNPKGVIIAHKVNLNKSTYALAFDKIVVGYFCIVHVVDRLIWGIVGVVLLELLTTRSCQQRRPFWTLTRQLLKLSVFSKLKISCQFL